MVRRTIVSFFVVLAIVAGVFVIAPPVEAGPATGTATMVPSPNQFGSPNTLKSVSCLTSTNCTAVGSYTNGSSIRRTLVMTWDGTSWSTVTSPNTGVRNNSLNSVSCSSSTSCTAIGTYSLSDAVSQTLAMTWNGTVWSVTTSPNPGTLSNSLNSVTCTSSTWCTAVGTYTSPWPANSGASQTLIATWDGSAWSAGSSPNPGNAANELNSVSCLTSSDCTAVGSFNNGSGNRTLALSWNGTSWSTVSSPNTAGVHNYLNSVSCTSSSFCTAVGYARSGSKWQTLAMAWNGSVWTIVTSPNPDAGDSYLDSVSCTSTVYCIAVGRSTASSTQSLSMTWDGSVWTIVTSPNPSTSDNRLNSVACTSSTLCTAVGYFANSYSVGLTLVLSWNGSSWTIVTSPNTGITNSLNAVSCVSSTFCAAVGYFIASGSRYTLAMTWDGSAWTTVASPNASGIGASSELNSVSCTSSTFCIAVGYYSNRGRGGPVSKTLAMTWNGTTWSTVTSPNTGAGNNTLKSVTCVNSTFCIAVGYYVNGSLTPQPLGMDWDGTTWTTTTLPDTGGYSTQLNSVSCSSPSSCSAVGYFINGSGVHQTLVIKWDGATIAQAASPNTGTGNNELNSLSCTSSTFCTAVGTYYDASVAKTSVMTWNGTTWTATTSPNTGINDNVLLSVSCSSSTSCTAVGYYVDGSVGRTLVLNWNGSLWTNITSPNSSTSNNYQYSVSCSGPTSCTSVGSYTDQDGQTLTLATVIAIAPPFVAPSAPTSLVATPGNGSVSIAFTSGAAGDAAITKYQYTTNNGTNWADVNSGGTSSPVTITGLTNYTAYSIKLRAYSTADGTASTAVSVTTKIAAPAIATAYSTSQAGNASRGLYVSFTGVNSPGTTTVSYRINVYAKGTNTVISTALLGPTVRGYFLGGVTRGVEYDIRVIGYLTLTGSPLVTRSTLESTTRTVKV